jgi:hypothetical protein
MHDARRKQLPAGKSCHKSTAAGVQSSGGLFSVKKFRQEGFLLALAEAVMTIAVIVPMLARRRVRWARISGRTGWLRDWLALRAAPLDNLVELSPIKPYAPASGAIIDLYSLPLGHHQQGLVERTQHSGSSFGATHGLGLHIERPAGSSLAALDALVKAVLDCQAQLLEPEQLDTVRKPAREFAADLIVNIPVNQGQSVDEVFHSRSPIDKDRSGHIAMQEKQTDQNLHRVLPRCGPTSLPLQERQPEGPGPLR